MLCRQNTYKPVRVYAILVAAAQINLEDELLAAPTLQKPTQPDDITIGPFNSPNHVIGDYAELLFRAEARLRGFITERAPHGGKFDVVLDNGYKLLKIELKATTNVGGQNSNPYYALSVAKMVTNGRVRDINGKNQIDLVHKPFSPIHADFLVGLVDPLNLKLWYIFPAVKLEGLHKLSLYPPEAGMKRVQNSKYDWEPYRDRWDLFLAPPTSEPQSI